MTLIVNADGMMNDSPLTLRERDILNLWARGLKQKQIAAELFLSPETVKKHLRNVYKKLNAHNKVQALTKAGYL
ncbi:response regulator transcription factor [Flavisolibacter nicotianae]|uniref:response regulator transcription factor n=1 Tax=Flavisolibacter nicotianae TaxID=2364882 RepID=UPI000EAD10C5|nr:helix-turn-helix transcriptional regulator [Flavisolibacter nicotianae]